MNFKCIMIKEARCKSIYTVRFHLNDTQRRGKSNSWWEFPGSPAVGCCITNAGGTCSIPGQGTKIPHDLWLDKKKKKKTVILGDRKWFSSVQFSRSVMSDSLQPRELQHARPPCPSPTSRVYPDSYPLSQWCHPAISSSVVPFSSCPQSLPASRSFQMSQFFESGGQSIGVSTSTSVLPMNTQDWFPLGWTGWISWQSKGLSRVFSNTTVQKHQFFGTQLSL